MAEQSPLERQGGENLPAPVLAEISSSPLLPQRRTADLLSHFWEGAYDVRPESHLFRLVSALAGDSGAGQLRKHLLISRLRGVAQGTHFYDLDSFYGGIFGARRRASEFLDIDPTVATATSDEWDEVHARDSSYRNRISLLARGIHHGATSLGMEVVAEALTGVDCQVYELWQQGPRRTYADLGAFTYTELSGYSYDEMTLEVEGLEQLRSTFLVRPRRPITISERYDLKTVFEILRPAASRAIIDADGLPVHRVIDTLDLHSDSEYWEVTAKVQAASDASSPYVNDGGPTEQPRPPFGGYQGEAWNYNGQIVASAATTLTPDGLALSDNAFERIRYGSGVEIDYGPSQAFKSQAAILRGRAASDGISLVHPYGGFRDISYYSKLVDEEGGYVTDRWVGLQIDRLPVIYLNNYLRRVFGPPEPGYPHERFWSTPQRPQDDPRTDVLEAQLTGERIVNYLSFELPRFPHTAVVEYFNEKSGVWTQIYKRTMNSCVPTSLNPNPELPNPRHPQHTYPDHWELVGVRLDAPVTFRRIRFRMTRHENTKGPRWWKGLGWTRKWTGSRWELVRRWKWTDTPYSLGVRGVEIGYRIHSRADIQVPVSAGTDSFGATVEYSLKEHPARSINSGGFWKSEPQPVTNAVVSLYADARTALGEAQTVDSMYLDPLSPGPHFTIYYSNDEPGDSWPASAREIEADIEGEAEVRTTGLNWGSDVGTFNIDQSVIQVDTTKDWSFYVSITPRWFSSEANTYTVFDIHGHRLVLGHGMARLLGPHGAAVSTPVVFSANANLRIVGGRDGETLNLSIKVASGPEVEVEVEAAAPTNPRNPTLRIGAAFSSPRGLNSLMTYFMIKQAPPTTSAFMASPQATVELAPTNDSALLRFSTSFITEDNATGFLGGVANHFAALAWRPISLDFTLQRGTISIPPTRAKYFKFEFTNLVPEPYESFIPMTRTIRVFPPEAQVQETPNPLTVGARHPGLDTLASLYGDRDVRFRDSTDYAANASGTTGASIDASNSPTDAYVASNPAIAGQVKGRSELEYVDWHQGMTAPRFSQDGVHNYHEIEVRHDTKVGFFVGLADLRFYRIDYMSTDDPVAYYERFDDAENIATSTWDLDPNRLASGDGVGLEAQSKVFDSANNVRAVQFATQQTPPTQIMQDDDFLDEEFLSATDWTDTDNWHRYDDAVLAYEKGAVTIFRNVVTGGTPVGDAEPIVAPPSHPIAGGGGASIGSSGSGGVESPQVLPSEEGSVWAAVRFTPEIELDIPYLLQIVRADTEVVLVEKEVTGLVGETREEYIGYEIGSIAPASTPLRIRFIQIGVATSKVRLDTLSLFDSGILWEFSVDGGTSWTKSFGGVRNNPFGVISFKDPGRQLVWRVRASRPGMYVTSLQIRPMYEGMQPSRLMTELRGPAISTFDRTPPITEDPEFAIWSKPVPYSWFLASRRFPVLPVSRTGVTTQYSKYLIRNMFDGVPEVSHGSTEIRTLVRGMYDTTPNASDDLGRTGIFGRDMASSLDATDDTVELGPLPGGEGIVHPAVNPMGPEED